MFNFSKEKCPVCKMELEKGKKYPEASGKKFCSDGCKDEYQNKLTNEQSQKSHGSCCH